MANPLFAVHCVGDRGAMARYAVSPRCPPEFAGRIQICLREAADHDHEFYHCLLLTEALRDDAPTPDEIKSRAKIVRDGWHALYVDQADQARPRRHAK